MEEQSSYLQLNQLWAENIEKKKNKPTRTDVLVVIMPNHTSVIHLVLDVVRIYTGECAWVTCEYCAIHCKRL